MFANRTLFITTVLLAAFQAAVLAAPTIEVSHDPDARCSVFTLAKGEHVFFGGNDDYINPDSWYWVDPGDGARHGVVWIGEPDNVQQGVNDAGLAYDANGLPRVDVNPHRERAPVSGGYTSYPIHIMHECSTVAEVIAWIESHEWHSFMHDQMQFADAGGDAVIVSAGADGEVVYTRKEPGDGFLVSTNFNVARPSNGFGHPCWRYDRATELLGELVAGEQAVAVEDAAGVLDAVHVEGASSWTLSSLVADLPAGLIYLYLFHQFDRPLVLNVREELSNPRAAGPLSALFPAEVREEAARRHARIAARGSRCRNAGAVWLGLVLASLAALLRPAMRGEGKAFWTVALLVLGPLALIARLVRRPVFVEAVGDMVPVVTAFVAFLGLVILAPALQGGQAMQMVLVLGLPFAAGLIFHGAILSPGAGGGRFLAARAPQILTTASIGLAGISLLGISLVNLSIRNCELFPPGVWTFVTWWLIAALSALPGILLIAIYEFWALRCGFAAWSAVAAGEGPARTPGARSFWIWVPVSLLVLAGGILAGAALWGAMAG